MALHDTLANTEAEAGSDDFEFTRIVAGHGGSMPVGGDITYRRMTAAADGRWADSSGVQRDVLDILAARGVNLARIRIYNQPGNTVNVDGTNYRLQPGWQNGLDADGLENYGATPDGQLRYMREYLRAMAATGNVAAVSYWDPIWIDLSNGADANGWVVGGDNSVEDTTFFGYGNPHREQPGLAAFGTW
ncbi:glycosyl hydrolase 53 family protein [Dactylosporangium sp. NPDC051541]|uniref:glycosyl hydrolase 53 family protein n=1 Tax=Dactylosporangium sp. NPDC051541 TaxID=3363977 RepID=UPI00379F5FF7